MLVAAVSSTGPGPLDLPTLVFAAVCLSALLGLFLIFAWLQERNIRALAWWGAAYLIGSSAIALWNAPAPMFALPDFVPATLIFLACGMIWNGVRLFHGRRVLPFAALAGGAAWLIAYEFTEPGSSARVAFAITVVALYTFCIAFELWRERRKSLYSRAAAIIVPALHAAIFLLPIGMKTLLPDTSASEWLAVFAIETMIYAIGTAFIVLLMVKDHHVDIHRSAAATDHLTGLLNRRAFLDGAAVVCARQAALHQPVTLLMFDLDHFKSINDRFGHAAGDQALQLFAQVGRASMRTSDLFGRIGGEEFAALVPGSFEAAGKVADRLRVAFQAAGVTVGPHPVGATVSIGAATAHRPVTSIDALIARADVALYRAKHEGRNRICVDPEEPARPFVRPRATEPKPAQKPV